MKRIFMMLLILGWIHDVPLRCSETVTELANLPTLANRLEQARSAEEMDRLARSAAEQRDLFAGRLIMLLRTSNSIDLKVRACYLVGEFRAERAVNEVIKNIGLTVERGDTDRIPLWSRHPCVDALAYIGKPAERTLLQFIAGNDKKELQALALEALVYINGFKHTPSILEDALQGASSLEGTRLRQALEELRHQQ
jgi:hypothetical protein